MRSFACRLSAVLLPLPLLLVGCQGPGAHQTAKEVANERWNSVRANVKARLASEQLAIGATDKAAVEIANARQLDPDNIELKLIEARVLLADGHVEAADALLADIDLEGEQRPEVAYLRGVVAQQQLRWERALDYFLNALDGNPRDVAYLSAAVQVLLQLEQADSARALLQVHARAHQWTPAYQLALAECSEQLEDWDAAANAWQQVLSDTEDLVTLERLALALERAGRCREAVLTLEVAIEQAEKKDQLRLLLGLARCESELEDYQGARQRLQQILARHPGHEEALHALAEVLVRQRDYASALPLALSVLERDPRNVPMLELAATVAHQMEDRAMAIALAERLLAADPASPIGQHLLAR